MTGNGPTAALWRRRSPGAPALRVAELLVGVDRTTLDDAVVLALAASSEATQLLDGMEVRVRTLTSRTRVEPVRCEQSVRGQILWSATIVARAGGGAGDDLFVCARATRTFDTPENRALVAALDVLARAAPALSRPLAERLPAEVRSRIAVVAAEAIAWRRHPRLADLRDLRLDGRSLTALRRGHRAGQVAPLLALRDRVRDPFTAADVESLATDAARAVHADVLRRTKDPTAPLTVQGDQLEIDGIRFATPGGPGGS